VPIEDVADLADGEDRDGRGGQVVEHRRTRRRQAEVSALGTAHEAPRWPVERPRDHATDGVLAGQDPARDATPRVELFERHHVHVGRDLENGVTAGVDDRTRGREVFAAQVLDDLGP
jgi:hypothetical protein